MPEIKKEITLEGSEKSSDFIWDINSSEWSNRENPAFVCPICRTEIEMPFKSRPIGVICCRNVCPNGHVYYANSMTMDWAYNLEDLEKTDRKD